MKLLRVDMSTRAVREEEVPTKFRGVGGRAFTSLWINDEVPPRCDALGPENQLIFAPGSLTGTAMVNTSRLSVGAKSPLTGTIKESNVGGTIPAALGRLGIAAIVIEGSVPEGGLSILHIGADGQARLIATPEHRGLRTYALCEKLRETYGDKASVLCIGPAGEYRLASASIQTSDVDGRPCRAAGRGGLGAVMGAKGLKAIVVDRVGTSAEAAVDPEAFKAASQAIAQAIKDNPFTAKMLPALGTAGLVAALNSLGGFPSRNATSGVLTGWEKISGEKMAELITKRGGKTTHQGCSQCAIHCSNEFVDEAGAFVTSSLEYETLWSMGGMLDITDLDTIARLDFLCDDLGLDTINTGVAVAVAMDAGLIPFGDATAALALVEDIGRGTEMGQIVGNGPAAVGRHFHHHRVPAVKGQSIAAYDPRVLQANGVTYATSPMGADHTAGNLIGGYLAGQLKTLVPEGQAAASRQAQIGIAFFDSTGLCLFAGAALASPEGGKAVLGALNARFGLALGPDDPPRIGLQVLQAEREFNRKAGFTAEDDRLPQFFYEEALPPHGAVFRISAEELGRLFDS